MHAEIRERHAGNKQRMQVSMLVACWWHAGDRQYGVQGHAGSGDACRSMHCPSAQVRRRAANSLVVTWPMG
jgi:hypothetical protein